MTIQYDPHQNIDGNVQRDERHTINVSQLHRVVVPTHAPFYYDSLVVKRNNVPLKENVDYFVSHRYGLGTQQTARLIYGSIWIINDLLGGDIDVDYHPLGLNTATAEQITAERERNKDETPTELDWEEITGGLYFPPVNIIFDRDDWTGEERLVNILNKMGTIIGNGGWANAAIHNNQTYPAYAGTKNIAPVKDYETAYSVFVAKKVLTFTQSTINIRAAADNVLEIYLDGKSVFKGNRYPEIYNVDLPVTPGEHTLAFACKNGTGPSHQSFAILEAGRPVLLSDDTWPCLDIIAPTLVENAVLRPGADDDIIQLCRSWLDSLQLMYDTSPAHAHVVDMNNPHGEEYGWIHALQRDGISPDTTKAFNKTLAELTAYVNARCQTSADLANKISRHGSEIKAEMLLADGLGIIGNYATGTAEGNIINLMKSGGDFTSLANVTVSGHATKPAKIKAGKNQLTLYPDSRGLEYNGQKVVTRDTIGPLIPVVGDGTDEVVSTSTPTVEMTGLGTNASPLIIDWKIPDKTSTAAYTMRPIKNSWGSSKAHGASPVLLGLLEDIYPDKITLANATINGKTLTNSIFLNPIDFSLGNVANLSDKALPISDAQQVRLDTYSHALHTHPLDFFGYGSATVTTKGIFRLRPIEDIVDAALLSQDVKSEAERIPVISDKIDDLMPAGVITIVRYGVSGNGPIGGLTSDKWLLTFPTAIPHYYEELREVAPTTINLKELFPAMLEEQKFYVFVNVVNNVPVYEIYDYLHAEDEVLTQIGTVDVDEVGITNILIRNVTRLGQFRELDEHRKNEDAHIEKPKDRDELGLGSLVNASPSYELTKPTFQDIFDTWTRFSHGVASPDGKPNYSLGNAQPANITELNAWIYNSGSDSVIQPINCGSYVGFVSPTLHETYRFDTILSSDAADNDCISVIVGFDTDEDGHQHTLSFAARQDGVYGSLKGTALVYNIQQTTQLVGLQPTISIAAHSNWNVTGPRRVTVIRDGDNYTVEVYVQNNTSLIEETFHFNIQTGIFDSYVNGGMAQTGTLSDTFLSKINRFRGAQPFGYGSNSQANSTYQNLQRPDEDGKNFYATLPELVEGVSPLGSVRTYSGTMTALVGKTLAQAADLIPLPIIKNYAGETIVVPKDRIRYFINNDRWMAVCHLDATMLVNPPA